MIDFDINEHDRLACRDAIARALDAKSPELALEALERFGEPLREVLYEWNIPADDDVVAELNDVEKHRDDLDEALGRLIIDIDEEVDALDEPDADFMAIRQRLITASSRAEAAR